MGGCRSHTSWVCSASARGRGLRRHLKAPKCRVCRGLPRAPGATRPSAHPSCALLGGRRALQADGGDAGEPDPRSTADAGRAHGGGGAAEREAAGLLLLPGRRMKPVWFGQVVARRAWRRSGPQTPGRWLLRIPHPPPAPLPSAISLWPLLSASQLLWQLGGTVHVSTAALKCAPPIPLLVQTRGAGARSAAGVGCSPREGFSERNQIQPCPAVGLALS